MFWTATEHAEPRVGDLGLPPRVRVLMVTNWNQWVMGTICHAIARASPWLEPTICSRAAVEHLLAAGVPLHERADVVHLMTLQHFLDLGDRFVGKVATVSSVHHVSLDGHLDDAMRADAIMGVSTPWMREMHHRGVPRDQTALVSLGVDTNVFRPVSAEHKARARRVAGLREDAAVVGFIGKASSEGRRGRKNTPIFIEALRAFRAREPRAAAVLVGPGWGPLVAEIRAAGLDVAYFPFISDYRDLPRAYHLMDLFWTTSTVEGGPMTALESMGCGVCLISTPVGVALDAIRDGENGFIVPFNDPDALVTRSVELMGDSGRRERVGAAARQTMIERFRWTDTARGARELYGKALARFAARRGQPPPACLAAIDRADAYPPATDAPVSLAAVPPEHRRTVRQIDELTWVQHLKKMDAWAPALRHSLRGWAVRPQSRQAAVAVWTAARHLAADKLRAAGTRRGAEPDRATGAAHRTGDVVNRVALAAMAGGWM